MRWALCFLAHCRHTVGTYQMCIEMNRFVIKGTWQEDAHGKREKEAADPEACVLLMMAHGRSHRQRPSSEALVSFLSPSNATAVIVLQTRPTQSDLPVTPLHQQMLGLNLSPARLQPTCSRQLSTPFLNSHNDWMLREHKLRQPSWGGEGQGAKGA